MVFCSFLEAISKHTRVLHGFKPVLHQPLRELQTGCFLAKQSAKLNERTAKNGHQKHPHFSRILRFVDNVTPQLLPKSEKRQLPKSFTHHSRSNFDVSFQVGLWQNSTCGPYQFEGHLQSLSHWQKQGLSKNPHSLDCLTDSPRGFTSLNT